MWEASGQKPSFGLKSPGHASYLRSAGIYRVALQDLEGSFKGCIGFLGRWKQQFL